jgi:hypothetical protein
MNDAFEGGLRSGKRFGDEPGLGDRLQVYGYGLGLCYSLRREAESVAGGKYRSA